MLGGAESIRHRRVSSSSWVGEQTQNTHTRLGDDIAALATLAPELAGVTG